MPKSNVEVTVKKTVNQLYNYSTVLGAAIKCKPYSEITIEIGTYLKPVKITLNIFAVQYAIPKTSFYSRSVHTCDFTVTSKMFREAVPEFAPYTQHCRLSNAY